MNRKLVTVAILFLVAALIYATVIMRFGSSPQQKPSLPSAPEAPESKQSQSLLDAGWAVVERKEDGNRVYWFLPPGEGEDKPAIFKKLIREDDAQRGVTILSECEAPKATCDELQQAFETLSSQYN